MSADPLAPVFAALDVERVKREYEAHDGLVFLPGFLPPPVVAPMIDEARALAPRAHRSWYPTVRKAGALGQSDLGPAPSLMALYRSAGMLDLARRLAGIDLETKGERDEHAAALYVYDRAGDHVGWHLDDCGCEGQASFTVTLGLVHETRSRAEYELYAGLPGHTPRTLSLRMDPGSLLFFCGSKPRHRVTPMGPNERRIVFSFAYVKPGKRSRGSARFAENVKDAIGYFGWKALWQRS